MLYNTDQTCIVLLSYFIVHSGQMVPASNSSHAFPFLSLCLCCSFCLKHRFLIFGFMDESRGISESPGDGWKSLCKFAYVHHSGKKVPMIHQTYKGGCDPRLFRKYSLSPFFFFLNNPNFLMSQPSRFMDECLLTSCYVSGTLPGTWNTAVNKTNKDPTLWYSSWRM